MSAKLRSALPPREKFNGLHEIAGELVRVPHKRHVLVMVVDTHSVTTKYHADDGEEFMVPTAQVLYVEPMRDAEDEREVMEAMARARAERMGEAELVLAAVMNLVSRADEDHAEADKAAEKLMEQHGAAYRQIVATMQIAAENGRR